MSFIHVLVKNRRLQFLVSWKKKKIYNAFGQRALSLWSYSRYKEDGEVRTMMFRLFSQVYSAKKTSNLKNFFFCITCYGYPRPWSNAEQDCNKTEMTYIKGILGRRKRSFCFPTYAAPPRLSVCLFIKRALSNDDDNDDDDCQKIYFDLNNLISVRSQDLFRRHQSEQRLKFLGLKKLRSSCFDFFNFNVSSSLLAWSG